MTDDDGCTLIGFVAWCDEDGAIALAGGDVTTSAAAAAHLEAAEGGGPEMTAAVMDADAIR